MREAKFQGTAGYVTRMSGGVGGRGREASSYPDCLAPIIPLIRPMAVLGESACCLRVCTYFESPIR